MLLFPVFRRRTACVFLKGSAEIRNVAVTGHHGNLVNLTVGIAHQILRLFHAQLQKIIGKGHPVSLLKDVLNLALLSPAATAVSSMDRAGLL